MKNAIFIVVVILLFLVGSLFAGNKVLEKRVYDLEDAEHMFRRANLMEVVGNRLFVVDNLASTLYVYNFEKDTITFVKKAAGPGQGPGDLHFPIALTSWKDKISIKDQQGFSFFDNQGKYLSRFKAKPGWDSFVLLEERIVSTQLRSRQPFLMAVCDMDGKVVKQFGEKYLDYNKSKDDKLPPGHMESLIYEGKVVSDGKYVYYVNFCFGHVFKYSPAGDKLAQFKLEFKGDKKREIILAKNEKRLKNVTGITINKDGSVMIENWLLFRDVLLFKGRLYGLGHILRTKGKVDPGLAVNNFDILVFDTQSFKVLEKHEIKFGKDDELQSFTIAEKQGKRVLLVAMSDEEGNVLVEYSLD